MLSIIIPAYNSNESLRHLLPLISNKKLYEVIIVDDHGSERVDEIVSDAYSNNVIIKRLKSNKGAGEARNIGLNLATRDYVAFFDADDMVNEPNLSRFLKTISISDSEYDIYFFSPQSHKPDGSVGSRSNRYAQIVSSYLQKGDEAIRYKFHVPWSKLYRREFIVENNLSFDAVSASNDVMFSLRAGINAKNIYVSENSYYSVQEHDSGLTVNDNVSRIHDRLNVVIRYNKELMMVGKGKYRISIFPLLVRLYKQNPKIFFNYLVAFKFRFFRDVVPSLLVVKKLLNIR